MNTGGVPPTESSRRRLGSFSPSPLRGGPGWGGVLKAQRTPVAKGLLTGLNPLLEAKNRRLRYS